MLRKNKGETGGGQPDAMASTGAGGDEDSSDISAPPLKPFTAKGSHRPAKPPTAPTFHPAPPRRDGIRLHSAREENRRHSRR